MNKVVLKFGGSSVADNIKLEAVAEKIIQFKNEKKNVVVVVSAQGKTTDNLIKEARELSAIPNERELDVLLTAGEQIAASKLSILLNRKGIKTISLTGWQAGIITNKVHNSAKIEKIYPQRILKELEKGNVVVVTGFQGINEMQDITTLGRGGSDTTAVALAVAIDAEKCYIFSDVDGIYSSDPNKITNAKKLNEISFKEMQMTSDAGAKVLHTRCIQIGEQFDCDIIASASFKNTQGTRICKKIENSEVKTIVKNDNMLLIKMQCEKYSEQDFYKIYKTLLRNNIISESFQEDKTFTFRILKSEQNKVGEILEENFKNYTIIQEEITKLTIIGYCITQDNNILNKTMKILENNNIEIKEMNLTQSKIEIIAKEIPDDIVNKIHENLIN